MIYRSRWKTFFLLIITGIIFCIQYSSYAHAQEEIVVKEEKEDKKVKKEKNKEEEESPVEINGDRVEFSVEKNVVIAEGNVIIIKDKSTLTADRVEYHRETGIAKAIGNVVLITEDGQFSGDRMDFDVNSETGDFEQGKLMSDPYYGYGHTISKVSDTHVVVHRGYITTCDHDKPHFRLASRKMDVYPGDKIISRNVRLLLGKVPVIYLPKFTRDLSDRKPRFTYTPGMNSDWGLFLLTEYRYDLNENVKGVIHMDAREKKDLGGGFDVDYTVPKYGEGIIRTYYTNERSITSKRFYQERPSPTIERERFKVEWRHKWEIDDKTDAILQYYRISDSGFLKDFFEREFEEDSNPRTFFLLTKAMSRQTFSFQTEARVNRFVSAVERLPELRHDLINQEIGNTGVFVQSTSSYVNLTTREPSPSEVRNETMRVDNKSELSYPFKFSIFEINPSVGGRQTYYSKTKEKSKYNLTRGVFETGADISTKFFRVFDIESKKWGIEVNKLRHIITPSVGYVYRHDPTVFSSELDQFDGVDSITRDHSLNFSLENKLQTKRNDSSVDLLRLVVDVPFRLKEFPGKGGFENISADIDFRPNDHFTFFLDSSYDTQKDKIDTVNFDTYISADNWRFALSKRLNVHADDIITGQVEYKINQKWKFRFYERFDLDTGLQREQEFTVTRDLHAWEMDINFNESRGGGSEIWWVFRMKAFPDQTIDFGTEFNERKLGTQTSVGPNK